MHIITFDANGAENKLINVQGPRLEWTLEGIIHLELLASVEIITSMTYDSQQSKFD